MKNSNDNNLMNDTQVDSSKKSMKIIGGILIIIGVAIILIIAISMFFKNQPKQEKPNSKEPIIEEPIKEKDNYQVIDYNLTEIDYSIFKNSYAFLGIVDEETDFQNIINTNQIKFYEDENLSTKDYEKYKYLLIAISYVECAEEITYNNIDIRKNKTIINFNTELYCGLCAPAYTIYEIRLPKETILSENVEAEFKNINDPKCIGDIAYKPILYLYPKEKTDITINFEKEEKLTTTYPKFQNEWKVTAYPNGDIYNNNKYYYALYWEEKVYNKISFNEGFYVSKDNAISFLEEKLSILGLNEKESNEFIMYWLPILENNKHNLVYFEQTEELQNENALIIEPQPDTIIRIRMHVKKVPEKQIIKEQNLIQNKRYGYTAIEWGGVVYN